VTAITTIGLDHTAQLGTTLEAIAGEKAGIVKAGVPVVTGVAGGPALDRIAAVAAGRGAPLRAIDRDFRAEVREVTLAGTRLDVETWRRRHEALELKLPGRHQAANAAVAVAVADALDEAGAVPVSAAAVRAGVRAAWIGGRFQVVPGESPVVVDGAHNPDGIEALVAAFKELYPGARPAIVFAAMQDKDAATMARALARLEPALVVASPVGSPRERTAADLAALFTELGVRAVAAAGPEAALAIARAAGAPAVLVCGSLYLAGATLERLGALAVPPGAE
jgi:dihydrofolate synthase/folylpolyglutamate synthase